VTAPDPVAVDVVVLCWNDREDAQRAIGSALASEGVDVRVHLVDNGSQPPFVADVADARVEVLRSEVNLGVGGGRNRGAANGSATLVCFLDSDAELEPSCLRHLVDAIQADPRRGLVAPVFAGQSPEVGAGRAPTLLRKALRGFGATDRYRRMRPRGAAAVWPIEFAIGACQLVRREAFAEVDGIDAAFAFGPEDVDFCLRLGRAGWTCAQVRDASCHHVARRGSRRLLSRRGGRHLRSLLVHYSRHGIRGRGRTA
jgi:GT2 family glycosyltransferase